MLVTDTTYFSSPILFCLIVRPPRPLSSCSWIFATLFGRFQDLASLGIVLPYLMPTTKVVRYVTTTIVAILDVLILPLMALQLYSWSFGLYVGDLKYYNYKSHAQILGCIRFSAALCRCVWPFASDILASESETRGLVGSCNSVTNPIVLQYAAANSSLISECPTVGLPRLKLPLHSTVLERRRSLHLAAARLAPDANGRGDYV
jgi:hypothetical protein